MHIRKLNTIYSNIEGYCYYYQLCNKRKCWFPKKHGIVLAPCKHAIAFFSYSPWIWKGQMPGKSFANVSAADGKEWQHPWIPHQIPELSLKLAEGKAPNLRFLLLHIPGMTKLSHQTCLHIHCEVPLLSPFQIHSRTCWIWVNSPSSRCDGQITETTDKQWETAARRRPIDAQSCQSG